MNTTQKPFVPSLQRTAGQSAPIAANDGKAYTSLDFNGDAGSAAAVADALAQIANGEGQQFYCELIGSNTRPKNQTINDFLAQHPHA